MIAFRSSRAHFAARDVFESISDSGRKGIAMIGVPGLTAIAMLAFAANSILCRLALRETDIDPAGFTVIRLLSGAAVLWLIARSRARVQGGLPGDWRSATALFGYAITFSLAYVTLPAGTGALLLFGAVQVTMMFTALWRGERLERLQVLGLALAAGGLVGLLLPGVTAPPWQGAVLMLLAGVAWGVYSLLGRGNSAPLATTAGNFLRCVPMAVALSLVALPWLRADAEGALYAVLSGALASGVGYAIWYAALPGLRAMSAATAQLSVPVIAAILGALLLAEPVTMRLTLASIATLGGIALAIRGRRA